jgi:DNA-binding GntR family transcriptional regulator
MTETTSQLPQGEPPRGSESAPVRGSTVDELALHISAGILSGRFAVGSWLRQGALAGMFGVSRQPVREALRQVQATGLVEIHPHRGALVRGPSPRDIREAYDVRAELEGFAASMAAERISDGQLARLEVADQLFRRVAEDAIRSSRGERLGDGSSWGHANDLFHEAVLIAADNHVLRQAVVDLHRRVPRNLTWSALRTPQLLEQNVHEHGQIHTAIEARDANRARDAMTRHVRRSGELVSGWFAALQGEPQQTDAGNGQVTSMPPSTTIRWPVM